MITYTVEGSGHFPIDMLRYDSCFPASEPDAHMIERINNPTKRSDLALHRVDVSTLRDHRTHATIHTPARWESFGWKVVDMPHAT